jgi:hypothetical protein
VLVKKEKKDISTQVWGLWCLGTKPAMICCEHGSVKGRELLNISTNAGLSRSFLPRDVTVMFCVSFTSSHKERWPIC